MSDKTEEPTPRRLRKAREEGDSGASGYAAQAVAFAVAVALVPPAVRALAAHAAEDVRAAIDAAARARPSVAFDPGDLAAAVVALAAPVVAASAAAAAVVYVVQTGGVVASKRLAPRLDRLDPAKGLKGLVSGTRLFAVARSVVAGAAVGALAYASVSRHLLDLARVAGRVAWAGAVVSETGRELAWRAVALGVALGVADLVLIRRAWMRRLKMTKDEVKREHKESEGDPQVKAARERAYRELMAQATIANVRTASVVVVNPTHLACALRYDESEGDEAPVVVASAEGDLAARIVQAAREWGVPVVRDVPLARALVELEVGGTIPEALYEAVAEILREVWENDASSDR